MVEDSQEAITLPHSLDAEVSLLGSLMLGGANSHSVMGSVKGDEFYLSRHRIIYDEMLHLWADEGVADAVMLIDRLRASGRLDQAGGEEYLVDLTSRVQTSSNLLEYARIIQEASQRRRVIEMCQDLETRARSGSGKVRDLIDEAGGQVLALAEDDSKQGIHTMHESLDKVIQNIEEWEKGSVGVLTGFKDLDELTNGLQPTDLVVVAGRPAMGKTTFALNVARHAGLINKVPVAIFSLEMGYDQIAMNLLSAASHVSATKMRKAKLNDMEWSQIIQGVDRMREAPIYIDDSPGLNALSIRARARRLHHQKKLGLIVVDYLQLLEMGGRVENRQQEISQISRSMKQLARELQVPILTISQLSRAVESRDGNKPRMSDLRESGAIEQDADVIMLLYRKEYYSPDDEDAKGKAEVIVAKQRKGRTGSIELAFHADQLRFGDLAYESFPGS
ncbi:MAG: replicative DNA helicase [bacterium]|nr:replicative DNA helicase [Planctomycetota bacterium]